MRFTRAIRRSRRLLLIGVHLIWGVILALTVLGGEPTRRDRRQWRLINGWMARLCRIAGLRVHTEGHAVGGSALLAANHITWQDIIVLQSLIPAGFVAKHEIRGWPLIGWLARRGNTLFIQRGRRDSAQQITGAMSAHLRAGQSLIIFPEGTTTDGRTAAPFRSRLFEPAIALERPIQPVALHYQSPAATCEELAFIGEETFLHHLLCVLGEPSIDAYIRFCAPMTVDRNTDRREAAEQARQAVATALNGLKS